MILEVRDPTGKVIYEAPQPKATQAVSPQAAFLVSDILQGNTLPKQNPIWSAALEIRNGPHGEHRPIAVKTGTANDARDLATYGYLAPPKNPKAPALAVGLWMGNSDHSNPRSKKPAISLTAAAPLWRAFVRELTAKQPIATFSRPKGVVHATIDAWTGGRPGPWSRETTTEWFIAGTQPGAPDVPHDPLRHQHRGLGRAAAGHRGAAVVRRGVRSPPSRHRTSLERVQGQVKMRRSSRLQRYET